jgi:hypothetical protein
VAKEREEKATAALEGHHRHPHGQVQRRQGWHQGAQKLDHSKSQTRHSSFPESDQYFCNWELVRQAIQDSATVQFRRLGSSSTRLSFDTLLHDRATNAWVVGASTDDVSTLSSMGGMVWTMGSTTDALPSGIVRTF